MSTELSLRQEVTISNRAAEVLRQLVGIKDTTKEMFFDLCDLLSEAHDGKYHEAFGYSKFGDWIDASELDISGRLAYYMVNVSHRMRKLNITRDELRKLPLTSIREIFSLKEDEHADEIKALVEEGENLSVDVMKERIRDIKQKAGIEPYITMTVRIPKSAKQAISDAFELAKRLHGSVVDPVTGDINDPSEGTCLEYICASFVLDPNNHQAGDTSSIYDAELIEDEVVNV